MKKAVAELTAEEWVSLINKEAEGLPACCANVSALRDDIIRLLREGGELWAFTAPDIMRSYTWAIGSHPELAESEPLQKLIKQVADYLDRPVPTPDDDHEEKIMEFGPEEHSKIAEIAAIVIPKLIKILKGK